MSVNRIVRLSYLLPALALLSGCGGGSAVPSQAAATGPTLSNSPIAPGASHYGNDSFVITAQLYGNDASVYQRKGYTLTHKTAIMYGISMPQGTATTPNGYWYLTNTGHNNVLVYKISKGSIPSYPIDTLDDHGQLPDNVSAAPSRNLVAVSNYSSTTGSAGSVSVYLSRQSEPARTLTYGNDAIQGQGIAIDHQGNCFWSFQDPNTSSGTIVEFPGCNMPGTAIISGLKQAEGIAFDQSGDLYYVDQAYGVYQCNKTASCVLFAGNGNGPSGYGFALPNNLNFDQQDKSLWLSDASGYFWAIVLGGNGHCKGSNKGKGSGLCVYQYTSVDGDPYGIAPSPGG